MRRLNLKVLASAFLTALIAFQPLSTFAATISYLPEGSTPPNYQQIKVTQDFSINKTSDSVGSGDTGGDGLDPIPYRSDDGSLRLWNVYHHMDWLVGDNTDNPGIQSNPSIVCTSNGERCDLNNDGNPDTDAKFYLSTKADHDITKPATGEFIVTRTYEYNSGALSDGSKLYVPIGVYKTEKPAEGDSLDVGIYCFDMELAEACGYTNLYSTTLDHIQANGSIFDPIIGAYRYEDRIFVGSTSDQQDVTVGCYTISSGQKCANTPTYNASQGNLLGLPSPKGHATMFGIGPQIYVSAYGITGDQSKGRACLDVSGSTMAPCSNFSNKAISTSLTPASQSSVYVLPLPLADSYCLNYWFPDGVSANSDVKCYNKDSGAPEPGSPAEVSLQGAIDSIVSHYASSGITRASVQSEYYLDADTNKTYFAVRTETTANKYLSVTICYDNNANGLCSGFGTGGLQFWDTVDAALSKTKDYGYNKDDQGCMWGLGDTGVLYSFDPETGKYPCLRSVGMAVVDASDGLCDPSKGRFIYAKTNNIDWSKIEDSKIEVIDSNGVTVKQLSPASSGGNDPSIDLTNITTSAATSKITVKVHVNANNSDWNINDSANIEVVYAPDTDNGKPYGTDGAGKPLTSIKANSGTCTPPSAPKTGAIIGATIASMALVGMLILGAHEYAAKRSLRAKSNK